MNIISGNNFKEKKPRKRSSSSPTETKQHQQQQKPKRIYRTKNGCRGRGSRGRNNINNLIQLEPNHTSSHLQEEDFKMMMMASVASGSSSSPPTAAAVDDSSTLTSSTSTMSSTSPQTATGTKRKYQADDPFQEEDEERNQSYLSSRRRSSGDHLTSNAFFSPAASEADETYHPSASQQQTPITSSSLSSSSVNYQSNNSSHSSTATMSTVSSSSSGGQQGSSSSSPPICSGCNKGICERFLLKAMDEFWHEDCLKCSCCDCRLGEVGSSLYTRANLILCKRDYLRLFGSTGICSACRKTIPAFEMVMRAKGNNYHLECFACQRCSHRFCVGDKFYLVDNRVLCEYDYEEEMGHRANMQPQSSSQAPIIPMSSHVSSNYNSYSPMQGVSAHNPMGINRPPPSLILQQQHYPQDYPGSQFRNSSMYGNQGPHYTGQQYMPQPPPLNPQNGVRVSGSNINNNNNNWCSSLEKLKKQTESLKTEVIN